MSRPFPPLDPQTYARHRLHTQEREWAETNCYVDVWIDPAHRVEVRYEYEVGGVKHSSTRIRQVEAAPTLHFDDAVQKQQQYPTGTTQTCYVNPAAPDEAVLQHGSRAALYSIWFPLLFVAGGVGMVGGALKRAGT